MKKTRLVVDAHDYIRYNRTTNTGSYLSKMCKNIMVDHSVGDQQVVITMELKKSYQYLIDRYYGSFDVYWDAFKLLLQLDEPSETVFVHKDSRLGNVQKIDTSVPLLVGEKYYYTLRRVIQYDNYKSDGTKGLAPEILESADDYIKTHYDGRGDLVLVLNPLYRKDCGFYIRLRLIENDYEQIENAFVFHKLQGTIDEFNEKISAAIAENKKFTEMI